MNKIVKRIKNYASYVSVTAMAVITAGCCQESYVCDNSYDIGRGCYANTREVRIVSVNKINTCEKITSAWACSEQVMEIPASGACINTTENDPYIYTIDENNIGKIDDIELIIPKYEPQNEKKKIENIIDDISVPELNASDRNENIENNKKIEEINDNKNANEEISEKITSTVLENNEELKKIEIEAMPPVFRDGADDKAYLNILKNNNETAEIIYVDNGGMPTKNLELPPKIQ